jgi:hypothetical protein
MNNHSGMFLSDREDINTDSNTMAGLLLPNDDSSSDDASSLSEIETESRRFNNVATPVQDNEDDDSDSDNNSMPPLAYTGFSGSEDDDSDNDSMPPLADKGISDSEDSSTCMEDSDMDDIPPLLERGPDSGTSGEFSMFSAGTLNRKKRKKGEKDDGKRQGSNHKK